VSVVVSMNSRRVIRLAMRPHLVLGSVFSRRAVATARAR
jgi:hypothetical protein